MENLFKSIKTIAIVGMSNKPDRPSYRVGKYLQEQGYRIIPVNPVIDQVLGEKAYNSIADIPEEVVVDLVDVFRKPEEVLPIVDEVIKRDIKYLWFQEGIVNQVAAEKAEHAGITVVMDQCMLKIHRELKV